LEPCHRGVLAVAAADVEEDPRVFVLATGTAFSTSTGRLPSSEPRPLSADLPQAHRYRLA